MSGIQNLIAATLRRVGLSDAHAASVARVLRFVITGTAATLINITALYALTEYAGIWYLYSSVLAFVLSFAYNFSFQKYWVFKDPEHHKIPRQLPLHLASALLGLVERTVLLYMFVEYVHIWYILAQAIVSILVAFQSFFIFRRIYR